MTALLNYLIERESVLQPTFAPAVTARTCCNARAVADGAMRAWVDSAHQLAINSALPTPRPAAVERRELKYESFTNSAMSWSSSSACASER